MGFSMDIICFPGRESNRIKKWSVRERNVKTTTTQTNLLKACEIKVFG